MIDFVLYCCAAHCLYRMLRACCLFADDALMRRRIRMTLNRPRVVRPNVKRKQ